MTEDAYTKLFGSSKYERISPDLRFKDLKVVIQLFTWSLRQTTNYK